MPKYIAIAPWPDRLTPEGARFFNAGHEVYQDWRARGGVVRRLAVALLACAELRSGIRASAAAGLYGGSPLPPDDDGEEHGISIKDQNDAAWQELIDSGVLSHVIRTHTSAQAARALGQYWLRPDDPADLERLALLATRWDEQGSLA